MKSSLEKRLDKLRQQRDSLNEQIRKVEREKANELRKLRTKKASLVGAAVLSILEDGQPIEIKSEADLLALLDGFLVSKTDRGLFGLKTTSEGQKSHDKSPSDSDSTEKKSSFEKSSNSTNQEEDISSDFLSSEKGDTPVISSPKPVSEDEDVNEGVDMMKVASDSASLTSDQRVRKRKKSSSRLPVKGSQEEMLNEFNV